MKVYKFGGASVKHADAVRNVGSIILREPQETRVAVISAMGKTTNAFEWLLQSWYYNQNLIDESFQENVDYHNSILRDLFPDFEHTIYKQFNEWTSDVRDLVQGRHSEFYDKDYDALVGLGEIMSTKIVCAHLRDIGVDALWLDARSLVRTDDTHREGRVDWENTSRLITSNVRTSEPKVFVTQGFIASNAQGVSTTLGREGSDYTAAIFAHCLEADDVTIWKDVPGVLNADPKWFDNTVKLDKISYREAIELSYYGASIIHPKTIKPLQNKSIPLYAKSFVNPDENGTVIQAVEDHDTLIPSFIFKVDQILISMTTKDFSFIVEENLGQIFQLFAQQRIKIHLMQNSALNFSVCVDKDDRKIPELLSILKDDYTVKYNEDVELVTIRHYDEATIDRVKVNKHILVDQRTRQTARMVMKNK